MSWCWPTAATACRVARSEGLGSPGARLAHPAVIAPEVTTTTRAPAARDSATSAASLSMAAVSTRPDPSVTDEEPIFTTTVCTRPAGAPVSEVSATTAGGGVPSPR